MDALGVPYASFPHLLKRNAQREAVNIGRFGPHWEAIEEDVSIAVFWRAALAEPPKRHKRT
jgi:hypothetical protein